jgi:hypothetical protein
VKMSKKGEFDKKKLNGRQEGGIRKKIFITVLAIFTAHG